MIILSEKQLSEEKKQYASVGLFSNDYAGKKISGATLYPYGNDMLSAGAQIGKGVIKPDHNYLIIRDLTGADYIEIKSALVKVITVSSVGEVDVFLNNKGRLVFDLQGSVSESRKQRKKADLSEASNLPAIAQVAGVAVNPKITQVVRQDTIFSTVQAMGLPVKINAMKNVVAEVPDMPTAGAVLQKIYQAFGIKGSFMVTWDGKGKLYWDPKTPVDKAPALAYAKQAGLPPPNFTKLLA